MENVNILSQMKHYDFRSPINITMIFEEGEDELLFQNALKEENGNNDIKQDKTENRYDDIKQDKTENSGANAVTRVQSPFKNLQKNYAMANQVPGFCHEIPLQNIDNKLPENSGPNRKDRSKTCEVNLNTLVQKYCGSNTTENIEHTIHEICKSGNNKETLDRNIKELLNIVSENLTMVLRLYYNSYYGLQQKNPAAAANFLHQFHKCKVHFFDLSYSTVVSLILPEEKNEMFVEKLLNKIVVDANNVLQGKCERKHVEPFYNEMIEWVKKKRDYLKRIGLKCDSKEKSCRKRKNENRILKTLLADAPPGLEIPNTLPNVSEQTEISASLHSPTLMSDINCRDITAETSICIFTAGDPEKEISININPDLLQNHCSNQDLRDTQVNISSKNRSKNPTPYSRQVPCNQRVNQVQHNGHHRLNEIHHNTPRPQSRAPPPQFYSSYIHRNTSNVNLPNFQNIAPGRHNYQTQLNNNPFASSVYNNVKSGQMYCRQIDGHSVTPIITNVTSLNPHSRLSHPAIGRCCICGKDTNTRCQKCNDFSYCSTLCQELDVGNHNRQCRK